LRVIIVVIRNYVAIAIIITIIPNAIATIPIFIIGADILLLYALLSIMRLAIKYSKFKLDMQLTLFKNTVLLFLFLGISCGKTNTVKDQNQKAEVVAKNDVENESDFTKTPMNKDIILGANQTEAYLPL